MGEEAYKVLKNLCDPHLPSQKSYDDLCLLLKGQFSKRVSVFRERTEFYELKQLEGESVNQWFVWIKNKASNCNFGAQLDTMIKDKFVTSLRKGPILDRVSEEEHTRSLTEIIETARKKEAAMLVNRNEYATGNNYINKVNTNKLPYRQESRKSAQSNQKSNKKPTDAREMEVKCRHCGLNNHDFAQCKYKKYKCNKCRKVGHLARVCQTNSEHNFLQVEDDHEPVDYENMYYVADNKQPMLVDVTVSGSQVEAEIDSGASRSVIPEKLYREKLSQFELAEADTVLRLYDGSTIRPAGKISGNR